MDVQYSHAIFVDIRPKLKSIYDTGCIKINCDIDFGDKNHCDHILLIFIVLRGGLCIEIDGDVHVHQIEYDHNRTIYLNDHNIRVIRFTNEEVLGDIETVIRSIQHCLEDYTG